MIDFNKLIDILADFLGQITSKRLAAYALFLLYLGFLFRSIAGQKAVNDTDAMILEGVLFVGIPAVLLFVLIVSITKVGGGDDMLPKQVEKKTSETYHASNESTPEAAKEIEK